MQHATSLPFNVAVIHNASNHVLRSLWLPCCLGVMWVVHGQVLTLRKETIEHKLATLMGECGLPAFLIVERPALMGYSIEKRVLPRMHAMLAGAEVGRWDHPGRDQRSRSKTLHKRNLKHVKQHFGVMWNVNALYLSNAKFEKYLETSAKSRKDEREAQRRGKKRRGRRKAGRPRLPPNEDSSFEAFRRL